VLKQTNFLHKVVFLEKLTDRKLHNSIIILWKYNYIDCYTKPLSSSSKLRVLF